MPFGGYNPLDDGEYEDFSPWFKQRKKIMPENDDLHTIIEKQEEEIARLRQYESMVHYIANDYIELSYEKAQCQRDDWLKRCRKIIMEKK